MTLKGFMRGVIEDRRVKWCGITYLHFARTEVALSTEYPFTWFGLNLRPQRMVGDAMMCTSGETYRRVG